MAYKTKAQLKAQVDAVIKVNGNREITPHLHNAIETNILDSFLALEGGNVLLSLTGYALDLTPTDDKHLVPKKYVDDKDLVFYSLNASHPADNFLVANDSGLVNAASTAFIILGLLGDMSITADGGNITLATNNAIIDFQSPARLKSYIVSGVPSAATVGAGAMIYISNESGGAVPAFSDGANWRRVTDRNIIS